MRNIRLRGLRNKLRKTRTPPVPVYADAAADPADPVSAGAVSPVSTVAVTSPCTGVVTAVIVAGSEPRGTLADRRDRLAAAVGWRLGGTLAERRDRLAVLADSALCLRLCACFIAFVGLLGGCSSSGLAAATDASPRSVSGPVSSMSEDSSGSTSMAAAAGRSTVSPSAGSASKSGKSATDTVGSAAAAGGLNV